MQLYSNARWVCRSYVLQLSYLIPLEDNFTSLLSIKWNLQIFFIYSIETSIFMILLKRTLNSILLLSTNTSSLLIFKLNVWCSLSPSQSRSNFHDIIHTKYTVYTFSQLHKFHYIFNIQFIYIFSLYWYSQNLLVNNFNWVTYSCTHLYKYIYIYIYIYVCVCVYVNMNVYICL